MEWNYKTDPDFKWPEKGEEVLLESVNGNIWMSNFDNPDRDLITAWAKVELPKKKRWQPSRTEYYWVIRGSGDVSEFFWCDGEFHSKMRETFGVYKTKEEAEVMRDKIKDFVIKEIGEV